MEYFVIHLRSGPAPSASLAFAFVLSGILFDENRLVGYGLMGIGAILSFVDIYNKSKS